MRIEYVGFRGDLYEAGRTEDGDMIHGESFYCFLEMEDGTRYAHTHSFPDTEWVKHEVTEEQEEYYCGMGGSYVTDQDAAVAKVEALVARVKAAGKVDLAHWRRLDSAYGTSAYERDISVMTPRELAAN